MNHRSTLLLTVCLLLTAGFLVLLLSGFSWSSLTPAPLPQNGGVLSQTIPSSSPPVAHTQPQGWASSQRAPSSTPQTALPQRQDIPFKTLAIGLVPESVYQIDVLDLPVRMPEFLVITSHADLDALWHRIFLDQPQLSQQIKNPVPLPRAIPSVDFSRQTVIAITGDYLVFGGLGLAPGPFLEIRRVTNAGNELVVQYVATAPKRTGFEGPMVIAPSAIPVHVISLARFDLPVTFRLLKETQQP